jgi:oxygen-independent coproporphyrinogen-3 oxidase
MSSIGLYIHIPYCLHKCGYCDFNSHPLREQDTAPYVHALLRELEHYAAILRDRETATVFFGGGTPTTLPVAQLESILGAVARHFRLAPDAEITLEANPATIAVDTLKHLRQAGFNRISIGVQSFHPEELKLLDRIHTPEEVDHTVARARTAGFDNLSLDLMFALPGQTPERWQANLSRALQYQPEHISTYNLTIEPDTAFAVLQAQGKLRQQPEDDQLRSYKKTIHLLQEAGYRHYEISNFARPGRECRHNVNYWENGEHLGLGAGASSYINGTRFKNRNAPTAYIQAVENGGTAVETSESLDPPHAMGETLMLGLRLRRGVHIPKFEDRFGVSFPATYGGTVAALQRQRLVHRRGNRLALSKKGLYLADSVILEFMP